MRFELELGSMRSVRLLQLPNDLPQLLDLLLRHSLRLHLRSRHHPLHLLSPPSLFSSPSQQAIVPPPPTPPPPNPNMFRQNSLPILPTPINRKTHKPLLSLWDFRNRSRSVHVSQRRPEGAVLARVADEGVGGSEECDGTIELTPSEEGEVRIVLLPP